MSDNYDKAKRRVQRIKKGTSVSFIETQSKEKMTGKYLGLQNHGGRSYAKVDTAKKMYMIPVTDVMKESVVMESYNKVRDFVFDAMENSDMDIDELRQAAIKKFGNSAKKHIEQAIGEMLD